MINTMTEPQLPLFQEQVSSEALEPAKSSELAEIARPFELTPQAWAPTGEAVVPVVYGVHLGSKIEKGGWNAGFIDESDTPVPDAGLIFRVEQASYGYTGIAAKPLPGYKLEALDMSPQATKVNWVSDEDTGGCVRVAADWGKMSDVPAENWAETNLGIPGGKAGVVRVTDPSNKVRYFVLGADFQGEPDNWRVTGMMTEVEPAQTALPTDRTALPANSVGEIE